MNQTKTEAGQQFKSLFLRPLAERKGQIATVILGSLVVSLSQASIIFIFGPVFKALFAVGEQKSVSLTDVLPMSLQSHFSTDFTAVAITDIFIFLPVTLAVIALIRGVALYLTNLNQERISLRIADHFRTFSFSRILESSYLKISEKSPAEWMSHIMNDVMFLQQRFSELFKSLIKDGLTVVGAILALAFINWQLTVALFLVSVPSLWILGVAAKKISMYTEVVQRKLALLSAHSADYVARFNEIFVHAGRKRELEFFERENKELLANQIRSIALRSSFAPSLELIGFMGFSFFLFLYSKEDTFLKVDPTFLMQFIIALGLCIRPLRNLGEQVSKLQETKGALSQNFSLFLDAAHPVQSENTTPLASLVTPFHVKSLSIAYGQKQVLSSGSFELAAKDAIVINGVSGSGKSTFLKCLAGLIPPADWTASLPWQDFSRHCCFVSQTPFLFDGTIRDNLTYGLENLKKADNEIIEIAKILGLDDVLSQKGDLDKTMNSYQTELSGGQKQRLTILRSFLSDKQILLLDEATSALDSLTEQKVMEFLIAHYQKRDGILIFVTHRPVDPNMFNKNWLVEDAKLHF